MKRTRIRATPTNINYPKGGVSCSGDFFILTESATLRNCTYAVNPPLRQTVIIKPNIQPSTEKTDNFKHKMKRITKPSFFHEYNYC